MFYRLTARVRSRRSHQGADWRQRRSGGRSGGRSRSLGLSRELGGGKKTGTTPMSLWIDGGSRERRHAGCCKCTWSAAETNTIDSPVRALSPHRGHTLSRLSQFHVKSYALPLLKIRSVAETFRTDPDVGELLDPAVFIGVAADECAAAVVERIQLSEVLSGVELLETIPIGDQSPGSVPSRFS